MALDLSTKSRDCKDKQHIDSVKHKDDEKREESKGEEGEERKTGYHRFINIKTYAISYAGLMICINSLSSYQSGVMTTLERQFGLSAQQMGLYLSGNNMSTIPLVLIVTYICRNWRHPPLLATGGFIYCVSSFMHVIPHFIYGTSLFYTGVGSGPNATNRMYCNPGAPPEECDESQGPSGNTGPFLILFFAAVVRGIGHSPIWPLGMAYLYTNADNPRQAALFVGECALML